METKWPRTKHRDLNNQNSYEKTETIFGITAITMVAIICFNLDFEKVENFEKVDGQNFQNTLNSQRYKNKLSKMK